MAIDPLNLLVHFSCMLLGASIGVGVSFLVNCTLIEISKSKIFAIVNKFNKKYSIQVFWRSIFNRRNVYSYKILKKSLHKFPKS